MRVKIIPLTHGKLILTIGMLMIAGSMLFWLFLFKHQEKELIQSSVKYGYPLSTSSETAPGTPC